MLVAPASNAFSTSSLTTDAARSTTSPAAIWSATAAGRIATARAVFTREMSRRGVRRSIVAERREPLRGDPAVATTIERDMRPHALPLNDARHFADDRFRTTFGAERGEGAQRRGIGDDYEIPSIETLLEQPCSHTEGSRHDKRDHREPEWRTAAPVEPRHHEPPGHPEQHCQRRWRARRNREHARRPDVLRRADA